MAAKTLKGASQAMRDFEKSFRTICDFVPDALKESTKYKDAFILLSDSFDAVNKAKDSEIRALHDRVTDLNEQISDLEDNEIDEEEYRELQDFRDNIEQSQINGIEPIYFASNNALDTQLMEAFGSLLQQHRPLDLLEKINAL